MSTFVFVGSAPIASAISLSPMGAFFGWFLVALLAFSVAGLLPMIFASVYGSEDLEVRADAESKEMDETEMIADFHHREAA